MSAPHPRTSSSPAPSQNGRASVMIETPVASASHPEARRRRNPRSFGNNLAAGHGPHRPPCLQPNAIGYEVDRAIGLEDVHSPRMPAPRGGGHLVLAAAAAGQVEVGPVV